MEQGSVLTVLLHLPWTETRPVADWNLSEASGAFCGALIFLLRSRESKWFRKSLYFIVSLIGGFSVSPEVVKSVGWLAEWPAAFLSAAAIVTLATGLLDWMERTMPTLLMQFAQATLGAWGGGTRLRDAGHGDERPDGEVGSLKDAPKGRDSDE